MTADSYGNIFISDTYNHRIRKLSPDGAVTTFAGTGEYGFRDGRADKAQFGWCFGITIGTKDDVIFVSDFSYHTIRKIEDGYISTLAGNPGESGYVNGKGREAL